MTNVPRQPKLTLSFVRNVVTPGKYYDHDGLILVVSGRGAKRWVQRLTIDGRRRDLGLGSAFKVTPAAARRMAAKNRLLVRSGKHPLAAPVAHPRGQLTQPQTLARFVLNRYRRRTAEGGGLKSAREEYGLMRNHIHPRIGRRPVAEISPEEIRVALEQIRQENPNVAKAARTRLIDIFDEAVRDGFRPDNPRIARRHACLRLQNVRPPEGDERSKRVLEQLPLLLETLEASPRRPSLLRLIRFNLLTLRAPQECRLARWEQFDLIERVWRFPKMQSEEGVIVEFGLSDAHITLLNEALHIAKGGGSGWVFCNPQSNYVPYKANAAYKAMRDLGFAIQILDFRRAHEYWARRSPGGNVEMDDWLLQLRSSGQSHEFPPPK